MSGKKNHEKKEEYKDKKKKEKTTEEKLEEAEKLLTEMTDKYMRTLAELDNTRKRNAREKEDFVKYTKRDTIHEILPVLDNLVRAVESSQDAADISAMKKGIEMVLKIFEDTLKKMGAEEIKTDGKFDHDIHHAMHREHVEGKEDGDILEVFQKGYIMDGIVIRPAVVKVAAKEDK